MIRVCKLCAVITGAAIILVMLMASKPVEEQGFTPRPIVPANPEAEEDLRPRQDRDKPVIHKMPTFRGDIFDGFAEFRLQALVIDEFGIIAVDGTPYECLVNVDYITMVHRYEDAKETDYSCLMYFKDKGKPLLVRQQYKDVLSSIRRASGK